MAQSTPPVDFSALLTLYDQNEQTRTVVSHNTAILKCIRGGLRMAERYRLAFDPRADYWRRPERRFAVAYLADQWTGRFAPASAVRALGLHVLRHFDRARTDGILSYVGVDYDQVGGLAAVCNILADHARKMAPVPAWNQLRQVWPKIAETAGDDIVTFLQRIVSVDRWEGGFGRRLPWFGYLGAASGEDLPTRQAFFFAYGNLWTTTNAYVNAGAQAFAPVIQNTPSEGMMDVALQWAQGTSPLTTGFLTLGKTDDDPQDRSSYSTVVEIYGFLNLQRAPFYNNLAETYREWFGIPEETNAYELTAAVGRVTGRWLEENPAAVSRLAALCRNVIEEPLATRVELEAIESPKLKKYRTQTGEPLLDTAFLAELDNEARADLAGLSERDTAMIALHLLLDSRVYLEKIDPPPPPPPPVPQVNSTSEGKTPIILPFPPRHRLPEALRALGERALAYLKVGHHVLFAGAPGTGKTTLAQFVGYAWDHALDSLPEQFPLDDAPLTTVGNSAWSSFHTVGGLMPAEGGTFVPYAGIFIDPTSVTGDSWRLRDGAIVLDEMNRADLDRCIGELYPLLSGSVDKVSPAGLPGVKSIVASPRFRVLATVNDTNLDDIVFPISEGLARRFLRIELQGGSRADILAYLGLGGSGAFGERHAAARDAIETFFEVARDKGLLSKAEDDNRLPFGVAYFALLRAWVEGRLQRLMRESTPKEQARDLLAGSIRTLGRMKKWEEALREFAEKA